MNKLLVRQLRKLFPNLDFSNANIQKACQTLSSEAQKLLITIDETYDGFDADRALAERSIELSSSELLGLNQKIREESERNQAILASLRAATSTLRPTTASDQEWLTTKDEAVYLANTLTKLIEEEKRKEKELEETKERAETERTKAEAILQSIGDGVFAVDMKCNIILLNPIAEELSGFKKEEALGRYYLDIFKFEKEKEIGQPYPKFVEEVISTGQIKTLANHTLLIRRDQTKISISDSAAPIRDSQGKINGCIVVIRDSSHERALEQAKDEFVSIAAHQLRTPLGSMRWNIETILKQSTLDESTKNKVNAIYQSNLHIIDLVNNLLNVSRIDQGRIHDEPSPTNIFDVIREVVTEIDGEAQKSQISIDLQLIKGSIPLINIDPKRFREVVENLLSNAIKYSHAGGKVTVSATPKDQSSVLLSITDEGMGIPKEAQSQVFSKFYRAENAARSEQTGSGLGLFVVKSYVEGWGGKVWFESEEGRGTTFWVELPVNIKYTVQEEPASAAPRGEPTTTSVMQQSDNNSQTPSNTPTSSNIQPAISTNPVVNTGKKILIVEDDQNYQQTYMDRLPQEGYQIFQALNGKDALEAARRQKPDLILLDIMLPGGMNGFDVLEQLKIDRDLFSTPVIMLTNLDSERQTALSIGATDYIVKADSSIDDVIVKIKQHLG